MVSDPHKISDKESFNDFIRHYFSLDIDSNLLFPDAFKKHFPEIWKLIQPYLGIKILRQSAFEVLITFMCAQGLGMRIIRKQVSFLSSNYGKKHVVNLCGKPFTYFSFPTPEALAAAEPAALRLCTNNNCQRANNIVDAARAVASGKLDLERLKDPELPLDLVRETLCKQHGIGLKIADCVMLFGLHRFSAFPIDTHVRQYLAAWFSIGDASKALTEKHYHFLQQEALRLLNPELAGFAGHILFHCWRKEVKRLDSY